MCYEILNNFHEANSGNDQTRIIVPVTSSNIKNKLGTQLLAEFPFAHEKSK